jgi:hypothetical protein
LAEKIGQRGVEEVCGLLREVAVQKVREYDIATTLADAVLVCMPETDEGAAKAALDRFRSAILAAVRPKLRITTQIFIANEIDQFLKLVS